MGIFHLLADGKTQLSSAQLMSECCPIEIFVDGKINISFDMGRKESRHWRELQYTPLTLHTICANSNYALKYMVIAYVACESRSQQVSANVFL